MSDSDPEDREHLSLRKLPHLAELAFDLLQQQLRLGNIVDQDAGVLLNCLNGSSGTTFGYLVNQAHTKFR
jgi:hypothetical protein